MALVGVIMGSISDMETLKHTIEILEKLQISFQADVVSAHRTPEKMFDYAKCADERGFKIIIAGAGGAAHLPGMVASLTHLPVIGVPVKSKILQGIDSLLSIVQMPAGVPVATVAIGEAGAQNAAILAAQILALNNPEIKKNILEFRKQQTHQTIKSSETISWK